MQVRLAPGTRIERAIYPLGGVALSTEVPGQIEFQSMPLTRNMPVLVLLGLLGALISGDHRIFLSLFGIRGIGSICCLMDAINHDSPCPPVEELRGQIIDCVRLELA
jgi:hypothetical protein